ncbi:MAG: helix-turn-helix domain-containing protein [Alphaproteobacteria bacterium]|nr:helix-turn-helix domain-containing protein [Alphaproteobacteria bacterium]
MPEQPNKLTKEEVREIDRHVGSRLRYRRIMMDYSQTYLADQVGLSFQQFQKYEKGTNRISASKLHEFARLLDVPVSFFFDDMPTDMKAASQATPPVITADDNPFDEPEVQEFVKTYRLIPDAAVRRAIFLAVKAVARSMTDEDIDDGDEEVAQDVA